MRRFRKTIGFLWPCDGLNDQEYWKFLPNDVSWLTARYGAETGTEELSENNLQKYSSLELLRQTAKLFPTAKLDSVACGDHAASFIFGKKHEDELIDGLKHVWLPGLFSKQCNSKTYQIPKYKRYISYFSILKNCHKKISRVSFGK